MATLDNWETILRTKRSEIHRLLELDDGLHGELIALRIFTKIELSNVWPASHKKASERLEDLLLLLEKKTYQTFQKFCVALERCGQARIVEETLSKPGGFEVEDLSLISTDCGNNNTQQSLLCISDARYIPVSEVKVRQMRSHWNDIVEKMRIDVEVIGKLRAKNAFSEVVLKDLQKLKDDCLRNEELLQLLDKGSEFQYETVCEIMSDTGQEVITSLLKPQPFDSREISKIPRTVTAFDMKLSERPWIPKREPYYKDLSEIKFGTSTAEFLAKVEERVLNETAYRCSSKPRGRAIIINNTYFPNLPIRVGAKEDEKALDYLFSNLEFKTDRHPDLAREAMLQILKTESRLEEHRNYDMFVLILMTHGISGYIYSRDEKKISIENEIMTLFDGDHCPYLVNKPKLFFVQACQGDKKTRGVVECDGPTQSSLPQDMPAQNEFVETAEVETDGPEESDFPPKAFYNLVQSDAIAADVVHPKADMALASSTVNGYVSYRRPEQGTFFVHCLLDVFSKKAHEEDLQSMLTEVYKRLHDQTAFETTGNFKQIGEKRDTLRRKVYLLPKQPIQTKSVIDDVNELIQTGQNESPGTNDVTMTQTSITLPESKGTNDVTTTAQTVIMQPDSPEVMAPL